MHHRYLLWTHARIRELLVLLWCSSRLALHDIARTAVVGKTQHVMRGIAPPPLFTLMLLTTGRMSSSSDDFMVGSRAVLVSLLQVPLELSPIAQRKVARKGPPGGIRFTEHLKSDRNHLMVFQTWRCSTIRVALCTHAMIGRRG